MVADHAGNLGPVPFLALATNYGYIRGVCQR